MGVPSLRAASLARGFGRRRIAFLFVRKSAVPDPLCPALKELFDAPWNEPVPMTFYGDGPLGYTDYPALS